ncbi:Maf-like protein [Ulvibacterium sp.]|uniref:Maf-like protein n=1 Tax=Ulvibacterium sp. TaxID=2665914 RepID=UPI003CC694FE
MLQEKLKGYSLILASGSPRRQQFFRELGLDFEIRLRPIEEKYPQELKGPEISDYLAQLKAAAFTGELKPNEILITSDTVVWHNEKSLAKPINTTDAFAMLKTLSGDWHEVITSVCFTTTSKQKIVTETTRVKFKKLTDEEIQFYVNTYKPFDKAGGYGIQDWIGLIAIKKIKGSYTNVVGLPTHMVYKTLTDMVG